MKPERQHTESELEPAETPIEPAIFEDTSLNLTSAPNGEADSLREEQRKPALEYPVVGIGASAGGLQAFQELLGSLDPTTGMSFALITHLAPDQRSYLTEILAQNTRMPVLPIENGARPEPNHLYVLLPNQLAALDDGAFRVFPRPAGARSPMPIDLFFRSLASEQKNFAVGVVLSGADADGAFGLKTIKGEGGLALVQAPETATHGSMPRSSIAADHVDLVKAPAELGLELSRLAQQFAKPNVRALELGEALDGDEQHFQRILQMLRGVSGLEFQQYKPATLRRRIGRRMMLMRLENLADYARFLQVRPEELRLLQDDALINVTRFFRDAEVWEYLSSDILPGFFRDHLKGAPVRIWCAGCSSGEEAYSLAILFLEHMGVTGFDTPIQLFGTDASERSIEMARNGIYPESLQHEISEERLRRYFVKIDRGYQVSKRVRDLCIFARQNFASDPPFSHMDFVSCRNVLIYLNAALQQQVLQTFHYALDPAGYLLLGSSESLREVSEMFATVDRRYKIYRKVGARISSGYSLPPYFLGSASSLAFPKQQEGATNADQWPEIDLQRAADRIVLARYGPPGLIVDDQLNVLQSRGDTKPFIDLSSGPVSWNLSRVLRESIAFTVMSAVERSIAANIPTTLGPVTMLRGEIEDSIRVEVLPIASAGAKAHCFLILFENANEGSNRSADLAVPSLLNPDAKDQLIAQLRQDLEANRFHLQSLIEERDSRNQELVSANEEIQSANEELQSTNEELGTTKEELQSTNEELQTVNEELQQRNSVLVQTGNDLNNLLNSVNIPLLMLNNDLQIRQFTPPMQRLLSVRSSDIGRSINEIRLHLSIGDLEPMLREVMETLGTREQEVQDREGKWYLLRVRPYRTSENKIEGLVVLLMDIDQIRRSQQELRDARDLANSMLESVPIPLVVLNQDCTVRTANGTFRELSQLRESQLVGRSFPDVLQYLWGFDTLHHALDDLRNNPGSKLTIEHVSTTQRRQTLLLKGEALAKDGEKAMLITMEDITAQRQENQILTCEKSQLENEIVVAAHRLERTQEELRGLTAHLFTVQEEERRHVARELHDDISQNLSILDLHLKALQDKHQQGLDAPEIDQVRSQLSTLANDVRRISHRLHPAILDDLGLPAALKALAEEFGEREGMTANYYGINVSETIPTNTAAALYRIAQEALRNVAKHAGKTHVKVLLELKDEVVILQVIDLGVGFDQEAEVAGEGLGLISMTERARQIQGQLSIRSALGKGTTLTVEAPIKQYE